LTPSHVNKEVAPCELENQPHPLVGISHLSEFHDASAVFLTISNAHKIGKSKWPISRLVLDAPFCLIALCLKTAEGASVEKNSEAGKIPPDL